jgi:hypothetical protein
MSKDTKNYIVYVVRFEDEIVYIGSGIKDRHNHCISGTSHVYDLNRLHFEGKVVDVKVIKTNITKQESLVAEKELILLHRPKFNKVYLKDKNTAIQNANIASNLIKELRYQFKMMFGRDFLERYNQPIAEIIKFVGVSQLIGGVTIPGVGAGVKYLPSPQARTLYKNFTSKDKHEMYGAWLSTVFEYQKTEARIYLKLREDFLAIPTHVCESTEAA